MWYQVRDAVHSLELTSIDTCRADIKALTASPSIVSDLTPAFEKYNEEQLATVKLPGGSQTVWSIHERGGSVRLA